ncbi:MAG: hypothetical protein IKG46_14445 [Solobacterium sp.]|nr:hypothetical protein [Solobacterium sp.]
MRWLHQFLNIPFVFVFLLILFSITAVSSALFFHVGSVFVWILLGVLCGYTLMVCGYWLYWYIRSDRLKKDLELLDILKSKSYMLALSMELNLIMALYYIYVWWAHRSVWFGYVAVFYCSLTAARFVLLREFDLQHPSLRSQYKTYVTMGYMMFAMMAALLLMSLMAVNASYVVEYPAGTLSLVTVFSLYLIINATRGYFRHRHFRSPLLSACQLIAIAGALLGILSIQTVWLPRFSSDPLDVKEMNIVTGAAIFSVMIYMSLYMILHGNHVLKYGLDDEGNRIDTTVVSEDELEELDN